MSESARHWGALWGDRPRAWARNEEQQTPVYEQALALRRPRARRRGARRRLRHRRVPAPVRRPRRGRVRASTRPRACSRSPASACPEADLRLGDLQTLPYADDSFDLVTGFTSFFFAEDMVAALREAGRVARPGAPIVIQLFGRPEHCDLEADEGGGGHVPRRGSPVVLAARDRRGARGAGRADGRARVRLDVGLRVPGQESLVEHMLAAGGAGFIAGPEREGEMREAIRAALAPLPAAGRQLPRVQRVARGDR